MLELYGRLSKFELDTLNFYIEKRHKSTLIEKLFALLSKEDILSDSEIQMGIYGRRTSAYFHLKRQAISILEKVICFADGPSSASSKIIESRLYLRQQSHFLQVILKRSYTLYELLVKRRLDSYKKHNENGWFQYELMMLIDDAYRLAPQIQGKSDGGYLEDLTELARSAEFEVQLQRVHHRLAGIGNSEGFIDKRTSILIEEYLSEAWPSLLRSFNHADAMRGLTPFQKVSLCRLLILYYRATYNLSGLQKMIHELDQVTSVLKGSSHSTTAGVHLTKGCVQMLRQNFVEARDSFFEALEFFYDGNFGAANARAFLYRLHIMQTPGIAKELWQGLVGENCPQPLEEIMHYLEVCQLFHQGHHQDVLFKINSGSYLANKPCGYSFGLKTIELLSLAALKEYSIYASKIESMRKLVYVQGFEAMDRQRIIYKILRRFMTSGFQLDRLRSSASSLMEKLQSRQTVMWDPTGYELIRVDWWFEAQGDLEEYLEKYEVLSKPSQRSKESAYSN